MLKLEEIKNQSAISGIRFIRKSSTGSMRIGHRWTTFSAPAAF